VQRFSLAKYRTSAVHVRAFPARTLETPVARSGRRANFRDVPDMDSRSLAAGKAEVALSLAPRGIQARRNLELLVCGFMLFALAPLIAIIALAILVDVGRPILFRQLRPGRHMRPFTLYKFRTMLPAETAAVSDRQRTSTLGRVLRRSRLDELPQLLNVLRGEMSFIGPRPLLPRDLPDDVAARAMVRPGITGWAQVNGGHKLSSAEKAALDRWYIQHASVSIDLRILYLTVRMMIFGERINRREVERAMAAVTASNDSSAEGSVVTRAGHSPKDRRNVGVRRTSSRTSGATGTRAPHTARILFLTHYFPPEVNAPASRTYEHGRAWAQLGHDVTIVTCAPNHPTGVVYSGYRNWLWQEKRVDGMRIIRLWTYLAANKGVGRRSLNYVSYMASALLAVPFLPTADVVISTSPHFFCGLAGYGVSRIKRAPWVLEIRDLWPESIRAVGAVRSRRVIQTFGRVASWAYRKADKIVVLTDSFRKHIEAQGIAPAKIEVIKSGVDLSLFRRQIKDERLARELKLEGKFVAGYLGTHGMAHGLETVLEAAGLLRNDDRIAFLLVGSGAERARLVALKRRMGLTNVVMLDQQTKECMPRLWSLVDASLVPLRRSDVFKTVVPSKLIEAMAMACPIVLGVDGESRSIVEKAGAGIFVTPEEPKELAEAVVGLVDDPEHAVEMGRNGRRHVELHYNRHVLAAQFEATLAKVAAKRPVAVGPKAPDVLR